MIELGNIEIIKYDESELAEFTKDLCGYKHVSKTCFVRFLVPKYLSFEDKALYLDCDTVCKGDISELYNADFENNYIIGCRGIDYANKQAEELGIEYKVIKPHTPKQNGRVERSHRKDQERFYYKRIFYSLEDLRNQGKKWRKEYNNFPMRPLGWLSPREFIEKYKSQEESLFAI